MAQGKHLKIHPERLPFETHKRYYLLIKVAVVGVAGLLALRHFLYQRSLTLAFVAYHRNKV